MFTSDGGWTRLVSCCWICDEQAVYSHEHYDDAGW